MTYTNQKEIEVYERKGPDKSYQLTYSLRHVKGNEFERVGASTSQDITSRFPNEEAENLFKKRV